MSGLLELALPPATKAQGRIHRIKDDEEDTVPKGIYQRKPRDDAQPAPANDQAAAATKPRRKRRATAVIPGGGGKPAKPLGAFEVSLNLRGGAVTISAAAGALTLAPDEVLALVQFVRGR